MISKELLSEVLGIKLFWRDIKIVDNIVHYPHMNGIYNEVKTINIYELAHKCKEWAWTNNYSMSIDQIGLMDWNIEMEDMDSGTQCFNEDFYHIIEVEAIFKVCEWILEQKATI